MNIPGDQYRTAGPKLHRHRRPPGWDMYSVGAPGWATALRWPAVPAAWHMLQGPEGTVVNSRLAPRDFCARSGTAGMTS